MRGGGQQGCMYHAPLTLERATSVHACKDMTGQLMCTHKHTPVSAAIHSLVALPRVLHLSLRRSALIPAGSERQMHFRFRLSPGRLVCVSLCARHPRRRLHGPRTARIGGGKASQPLGPALRRATLFWGSLGVLTTTFVAEPTGLSWTPIMLCLLWPKGPQVHQVGEVEGGR